MIMMKMVIVDEEMYGHDHLNIDISARPCANLNIAIK